MRIVNSEIILPKSAELSSDYIEALLRNLGVNFLRWAIVRVNENEFTLNVSHKTDD